MAIYDEQWQASHNFDEGNPLAERNSRWAMLLTLVMMVAEIVGGWYYNSMALLADGWHMSSHALALGLAVAAYGAARRYKDDRRFSFGTWKIEILGGYTSAVLLVGVAGVMLIESVMRLLNPTPIHYDQAIGIAVIGLLVNLACAWLLKDNHGHDHGNTHDHGHSHEHKHSHAHVDDHHHADHKHSQSHTHVNNAHTATHKHNHERHHAHTHSKHSHAQSREKSANAHAAAQAHDLNQRSAYIHVLSDAATSVLAIVALLGGKFWGFDWLDPVMGIVGGILVAIWAASLLRDTAKILLDAEMDKPVVSDIHTTLAQSEIDAEVTDLHVWRVGKNKYACIVTLASVHAITPDAIRELLSRHDELAHISVEVNAASTANKE